MKIEEMQFSNLSVSNGNERTSKTAELMMQLTQKNDNFFTTSFRVMRRIIIPSFHVFTEYVHLCVSDTLTRFYSSEPKNNFHMRKENIKD